MDPGLFNGAASLTGAGGPADFSDDPRWAAGQANLRQFSLIKDSPSPGSALRRGTIAATSRRPSSGLNSHLPRPTRRSPRRNSRNPAVKMLALAPASARGAGAHPEPLPLASSNSSIDPRSRRKDRRLDTALVDPMARRSVRVGVGHRTTRRSVPRGPRRARRLLACWWLSHSGQPGRRRQESHADQALRVRDVLG